MRSLDQSLPLMLLRAREAAMEHFRPHLQAHGVTEQQWRVLRALAEIGPVEAGPLARRVCLLMPSLSRILRDLAQSGLLKRSRKDGDGRSVIVSLTARGRVLFARMSEESELIYATLEKAVGAKRFEALKAELESLIVCLNAVPVHQPQKPDARSEAVASREHPIVSI